MFALSARHAFTGPHSARARRAWCVAGGLRSSARTGVVAGTSGSFERPRRAGRVRATLPHREAHLRSRTPCGLDREPCRRRWHHATSAGPIARDYVRSSSGIDRASSNARSTDRARRSRRQRSRASRSERSASRPPVWPAGGEGQADAAEVRLRCAPSRSCMSANGQRVLAARTKSTVGTIASMVRLAPTRPRARAIWTIWTLPRPPRGRAPG
jgi:hypothetical protein